MLYCVLSAVTRGICSFTCRETINLCTQESFYTKYGVANHVFKISCPFKMGLCLVFKKLCKPLVSKCVFDFAMGP